MPQSEYSTQRNPSPGTNKSGSSSGGSSSESSTSSFSHDGGSYSSEISPPSSASSTLPNHGEAKTASGLASSYVQRGLPQGGDSFANSNQNQFQHRTTTSPIPISCSVNVTSLHDVSLIQAQVEAAYPLEHQRPKKSTSVKHPHSTQARQSLRARLAASSATQDYYASDEDQSPPSTPRARGSGLGPPKSAPAPALDPTLDRIEQNRLTWLNELITKGHQNSPLGGESLIDTVIINNYHWRLANQPLPFTSSASRRPQAVPITGTPGSSSSSTLPTPTPSNPYPSPRRNPHAQHRQVSSPRPSMPIATKQLPYQNLAEYQRAMSSMGTPVCQ